MSTLVMKFSGSCVDTTSGLAQLLSIVLHEREHWDNLVLVVSALEGVTDSLIEAAHLAHLNNRRGYRRIIATLRTRHLALAEHLPLGQVERNGLLADIDHLLFDTLDVCRIVSEGHNEPIALDAIDAIISVGERLSSRIVAALLRQNDLRGVAIDAASLIVTDDNFGSAVADTGRTCDRIVENLIPMLERRIIPVVTGFLGATPSGKPTTLGRGGSSYSASILALGVSAQEVWIWTDVDGIMTGDPHEIPNTRMIPEISYGEVRELAYFGMQIIHTRMVHPLHKRHIPIRVKNVFKPQVTGTLIQDSSENGTPSIKAVTSIPGIGLSADRSGPVTGISRLVEETIFKTSGTHANAMISSQSSSQTFLCFLIPVDARPTALKNLQNAIEDVLREHGESGWQVQPVTTVTAIGSHFNHLPTLLSDVIAALQGVNILALALGPSGYSLSVIVDVGDGEKALGQIHDSVISTV